MTDAPATSPFMGSQDIPLTPEEYAKRYRPEDVPHVWIKNPGLDTLRIDMFGRHGVYASVLLLSEQGCYFPTLDGFKFAAVPHAYVHAPAVV